MTGQGLVLLPGLGADHRLFPKQLAAFPEASVAPRLLALGEESLRSYALRVASALPSNPLFLAGASFGGMVALEMARELKPRAVFLIGSSRSVASLPIPLRALGRALGSLPRPAWRFVGSRRFLSSLLGPLNASEGRLVVEMFRDTPAEFLRWGIKAMLDWKGIAEPGVTVYQIQGRRDRLIPLRAVSPDKVLPEAGHLLSLTHGEEVTNFLREKMACALSG